MPTAPPTNWSPQLYEAIVENSDDAIVTKDLDGIILSWNDAAAELYGYAAEEAIGESIELVIPRDLIDEEHDVRRRIAAGERVRHMETTRLRRDGSQVDVSFSISPVKDESGKIVAAAGFARDITDRKRWIAEQQHLLEEQRRLLEEQERLATIVENSDAAVVSKSLDGEILYWNKAATEMYGYTAGQAIGRNIDMLIPEALQAEEQDIRRRIAAGEKFVRYETQRRDVTGRAFDVELSLSPVTNTSGEIIGAAGFARDITESRTDRMLARVVIDSEDAIVVKSFPDHKITQWNRAAEKLYGYTEDEAIGQPIDILIPEDQQAADLSIRDRIRGGEDFPHHETIRKHRDGHPIDVSLSISPLRDAAGNVVGAARIARDITDKKALEKERARAIGLLERFVDFTAHDFKGPMQKASLHAERALRALGDDADPKVRERLNEIIANTRWMWRRTEGLLKIVSLDRRQTLPRPVDANAAFEDSVDMLRAVYPGVAKATITHDELLWPLSDDDLLRFLFQNLVQNACKYGREGVPVKVHASSHRNDANGVVFAVADNGIGVKEELRERLFEAYERDPAVDRVSGHGIGLNFCRRIVDWHGGRVWVDPAPEGPGSVFKFTLPEEGP